MPQRYKIFLIWLYHYNLFFNTIQSFFIETPQKAHKKKLLSEHYGDYNTIRRHKNWIAIQKREIESSV